MGLRPQVPVRTVDSDETLQFVRQMGIEYVNLMLSEEDISYDIVMRQKERLEKFGMKVSDAHCSALQKNKKIHLNLPGRDYEIEKFQNMLEVLGKAEIPFTSIAWQPNGILRTHIYDAVGENSRGGKTMIADQAEIMARPNVENREYNEEEIWDNFRYFMKKVIPVAEENHVRMALHPNDPPIACMAGIPSLIYNMDCYRRAFAAAGNSPALGAKLCIGCWLEGGEDFGDLEMDIRELVREDRLLCVHFRNVSSKLPYFEEVLAEDGYADMYSIMLQLVKSGSDAVIQIDHGFKPETEFGGMMGSFAYPTGYMKGLLHAAERALGVSNQAKL